ncbi:GPW/gp25 family protein [bacterium]|nr:GPW/gp25 family protein [bacterium]
MSTTYGKHLSFPFHINAAGRTATVDSLEEHVREEVIQLILTNPGERADVTEFGGGVRMLLFENIDKQTEGMAKARITQALARWLGERVTMEDLQVDISQEGKIEVELKYRLAGTEDSRVMRFQRDSESK